MLRFKGLLNFSHTFLILWALAASSALADTHVAVATNFALTAKAISKQFSSETGNRVLLSFGSSGKLYAQIRNGAPFDVFLSADQEKPEALSAHDLVAKRRSYAIGRLAVWIREPSEQAWFDQLKAPHIKKIALANPRHAPYGLAALKAMESLNLATATRSKWVMGENIAQAFQFVESGNADAGFIAWSQRGSIALDQGQLHVLSQDQHAPIRQDMVLLKRGMHNPVAIQFYEFVQGEWAQALILESGYALD